MESKHTKGKWIVNHFIGESSIYCPSQNKGIAKLKYSQFEYEESEVERNADHIVKCVNAHDELVKALKAIADSYEMLDNTRNGLKNHTAISMAAKAKSALSKLKKDTNEKPI